MRERLETFEKFGNAYKRVYEFFQEKKNGISAIEAIKKKFSDPIKKPIEDLRDLDFETPKMNRAPQYNKNPAFRSEIEIERSQINLDNNFNNNMGLKRKFPESKPGFPGRTYERSIK